MFNKVMTGGACQPGGEQTGLQQNAMTGLMDQLIMGDAKAKQAAGIMAPQQAANAQQRAMMDLHYQQMAQQEMMAQQFETMQINTMTQQPQHQNLFASQAQDLNSIWNATASPQQSHQMQDGPMMAQGFRQPWMMGAPMMGGNMYQNRVYQPQAALIEQTKEVIADEKEKQSQNNMADVTKNMVDVLSNSTNPKHRNSKFLKFLNKLNYGAYTLENDQLVKHQDKIAEFRAIETQRRNDDLLREVQDKAKPEITTENMYQNLMEESKEDLTEEDFDGLMRQWMEEGAAAQNMEQMMQNWGAQFNMMDVQPTQQPQIAFAVENPYMTAEPSESEQSDRLAIAKQLIEQQKIQEAILCLEAECQTNNENGEAWRLLGQLYQENDQDDFAICAFKTAYEIDPYDLDVLMLLGVSCTNELVERDAKFYLHEWLKNHPDFQSLPQLKQDTLDYFQLQELFDQAHMMKPQDTQVLLALGILHFIGRQYEQAAECFVLGIKENPTDHSLWNKFGACMSNNMHLEKACNAYEQALDLRPNYVRSIINYGLAKNRLGDSKAAANCFLNALMLNPNVSHVWTYLRQSLLKMDRFDLIEKLEARDPTLFKDEFLLVDPKCVHKPSLDRLYTQEILQ